MFSSPTGRQSAEIGLLRLQSQSKLKTAWERIFEKYGRSFDDEADEIDVKTGEIVVDRGHLSGMSVGRVFGDSAIEEACGSKGFIGMELGEGGGEGEDEMCVLLDDGLDQVDDASDKEDQEADKDDSNPWKLTAEERALVDQFEAKRKLLALPKLNLDDKWDTLELRQDVCDIDGDAAWAGPGSFAELRAGVSSSSQSSSPALPKLLSTPSTRTMQLSSKSKLSSGTPTTLDTHKSDTNHTPVQKKPETVTVKSQPSQPTTPAPSTGQSQPTRQLTAARSQEQRQLPQLRPHAFSTSALQLRRERQPPSTYDSQQQVRPNPTLIRTTNDRHLHTNLLYSGRHRYMEDPYRYSGGAYYRTRSQTRTRRSYLEGGYRSSDERSLFYNDFPQDYSPYDMDDDYDDVYRHEYTTFEDDYARHQTLYRPDVPLAATPSHYRHERAAALSYIQDEPAAAYSYRDYYRYEDDDSCDAIYYEEERIMGRSRGNSNVAVSLRQRDDDEKWYTRTRDVLQSTPYMEEEEASVDYRRSAARRPLLLEGPKPLSTTSTQPPKQQRNRPKELSNQSPQSGTPPATTKVPRPSSDPAAAVPMASSTTATAAITNSTPSDTSLITSKTPKRANRLMLQPLHLQQSQSTDTALAKLKAKKTVRFKDKVNVKLLPVSPLAKRALPKLLPPPPTSSSKSLKESSKSTDWKRRVMKEVHDSNVSESFGSP